MAKERMGVSVEQSELKFGIKSMHMFPIGQVDYQREPGLSLLVNK